jgi:hypothetical protein
MNQDLIMCLAINAAFVLCGGFYMLKEDGYLTGLRKPFRPAPLPKCVSISTKSDNAGSEKSIPAVSSASQFSLVP